MALDFKKTQHFTSNFEIILYNISFYPEEAIDPFAGNCDLQAYSPKTHWQFYDIDVRKPEVIYRDTLLNPPDYTGKSVITNPPYLAKNKAKDKQIFNKYGVDDLYKASVLSLIGCKNGILIIPVNFFTDEFSAEVRKKFLSVYKVSYVNVFTQQVFENTPYNICSFYFEKGQTDQVEFYDFFAKTSTFLTLQAKYAYRVGGEFYANYEGSPSYFIRLTETLNSHFPYQTKLFLTTVDTRTVPLNLQISETPYIGKISDRGFATLCAKIPLPEKVQENLCKDFNSYLKTVRKTYGNLLFTTFRDHGRKRISFDLSYQILTRLLLEHYPEYIKRTQFQFGFNS